MAVRHCVFRNGSQLVFLLLPWSSSHPSPSLISPAAFGLRGSATLETLPLINVEETEAMATGSRLTAMRARRHYEERQGCSAHKPNKTCVNNNKHLPNDSLQPRRAPITRSCDRLPNTGCWEAVAWDWDLSSEQKEQGWSHLVVHQWLTRFQLMCVNSSPGRIDQSRVF